MKLFEEPKPSPQKQTFYCDLDINRRINARANSYIHGVYYRGNNYAHYPMSGREVRNADGLTKLYFDNYRLQAGDEVLWRRKLSEAANKSQLVLPIKN